LSSYGKLGEKTMRRSERNISWVTI